MKKYFSVIFIFSLCIILTGCSASKDKLDKSNKEYENAINKLCEEYKLNDCRVTIDDAEKYEDIYFSTVYVYSDEYLNLSSNEAYLLAKKLANLDDELNSIVSHSERIISKNAKYYYDTKKDLHYLMKEFEYDSESVYTVRNGEVMYDIFEE